MLLIYDSKVGAQEHSGPKNYNLKSAHSYPQHNYKPHWQPMKQIYWQMCPRWGLCPSPSLLQRLFHNVTMVLGQYHKYFKRHHYHIHFSFLGHKILGPPLQKLFQFILVYGATAWPALLYAPPGVPLLLQPIHRRSLASSILIPHLLPLSLTEEYYWHEILPPMSLG